MNDFNVALDEDQRQFLAELLANALKEKRVEKRRTSYSSYREIVVHQEQLIEQLLAKLVQPAAV